jgi:hypothetical protein
MGAGFQGDHSDSPGDIHATSDGIGQGLRLSVRMPGPAVKPAGHDPAIPQDHAPHARVWVMGRPQLGEGERLIQGGVNDLGV